MTSGKKRKCRKCLILLTKYTWDKGDTKISNYICKNCRKGNDRQRHNLDPEFKKKQLDRYRQRRSAVIFSYGNECSKCQEDNYNKLTMCKIGGGRVDINFLYNNVPDKLLYEVLCYNCRCTIPNKDTNKKIVIAHYGGYCFNCNEEKLEKLTLDINTNTQFFYNLVKDIFPFKDIKVLCFNCKNDIIAFERYHSEIKKYHR
jgi:hypothetical protein